MAETVDSSAAVVTTTNDTAVVVRKSQSHAQCQRATQSPTEAQLPPPQKQLRALYRTQTAPVPATTRSGILQPEQQHLQQAQYRNDQHRQQQGHGRSAPWGKIFVDVTESGNSYKIYADLPGVRKEEIFVTLKENVLQIRAKRHRPPSSKGICHRAERFFGTISRALLLPNNCRTDAVVANYDNGVLEVTIAKKAMPETGGQTIPVS